MARKGKGRGWHGDKKGHSIASKKGWKNRKAGMKPLGVRALRKRNARRSAQARAVDSRTTRGRVIEPGTPDTQLWNKNPNRYDVRGIDTRPPGRPKGSSAKKKMKGKRKTSKRKSPKKKQWRF